jgi:hypothetical protein
MDWSVVIGWITIFFSFMSFLFYILQMRIKPLEKMIKEYKEETYRDWDVFKQDLEKKFDASFKGLDDKLDHLMEDDKDFRKRVLEELDNLKIQKHKHELQSVQKFVTKEDFLTEVKNIKEDRERDIKRLEYIINEMRNN